MTETTDASIKATKVRRVVDLRVVAEPPHQKHWWMRPQTIEEREKDLEHWVREFHDFMLGHRSQDQVRLEVERVVEDQCSACNQEWETYTENDLTYCAHCGKEVA